MMSMDLSIVWVSYFSYVKSKGSGIELFAAENNRHWRSSKSIGLLNLSDGKTLIHLQKLLQHQQYKQDQCMADHPYPHLPQ